jgi:dipeptidyl aminopeptidase/acylaminoacyl peptidase
MLLGWHYSPYHAIAYALNQYLANRGFLVISVNYRLGIGYGHAFHYPDRVSAAPEYEDLLAAAKYLRARPDVDPERLGLWGVSYGGYLTALALARNSEIFAAGVDVDGPPELVLGEFRRLYAPDVDENGDTISSPKWKSAPLLIIHGGEDRRGRFRLSVELERQLIEQNLPVEKQVIAEEAYDFLLFRSWKIVATTIEDYFERRLNRPGK